MDTAELTSMYAQIVNGKVAKEDSRFVTDTESAALWDQIEQEVEQAKQDNPEVVFAIPNEMPDPDEPETPDAEPGDDPEPDPEADPAADPAEEPDPEADPAAEPDPADKPAEKPGAAKPADETEPPSKDETDPEQGNPFAKKPKKEKR